MNQAGSLSLDLLLDRCIDRLLEGESWQDLEPADQSQRDELSVLMHVAWLLRQLSRRAPTMSPTRLQRIWRRTDGMLKAAFATRTVTGLLTPAGAV